MALEKYVDDDLIVTAMLFGGVSQQELTERLGRNGGNIRAALEDLDSPTAGDQARKRYSLITGYLNNLGTEHLKKLMAEGAGLDKNDVEQAVYWAQRDTGGTATPTLDQVLYHLGGATGRTKTQGAISFAATVRPTLQAVGRGDTGLMTTRTQYRTGQRPGPAPPPPPAGQPAPPAPTPGAPAPGGFAPNTPGAGQYTYRGEARPTQPLQQPAPKQPGGTLGGTLAGTTTQGQQTPGIKALPSLSPNASDAEVEKYIRKWYGYSAWILDVPELRGKMLELGREFAGSDVDEARIEGALTGTEWWKTHEADQRLAIEEKMSDPATYNTKVEGKYRALATLTGTAGFSIPEGRLREIAITAYDAGWDNNEMRSALAAEFDYDPTTGAQDTSALVGDLRQLASDYLVPLSEQTIDQWGKQIIAGTATNEGFTQYAKGVAKQMFGHYAADIDAGRTVKQLADPFVQTAARDLELTADQIDLMDPKWRKALELDPETGQPMQLSKWQRTIRSDSSYGWDYTQNARAEASEFAKKIAEAFGRS
jgi:hypothetical protein